MKNSPVHWSVIVPSIVVLGVIGSVLTVVIFFAGKEAKETGGPRAVAERYKTDIQILRANIEQSDKGGRAMIGEAMDTLLSIRVPREHLDAHLSSVIQLRALERSADTTADADIRARILEILLML